MHLFSQLRSLLAANASQDPVKGQHLCIPCCNTFWWTWPGVACCVHQGLSECFRDCASGRIFFVNWFWSRLRVRSLSIEGGSGGFSFQDGQCQLVGLVFLSFTIRCLKCDRVGCHRRLQEFKCTYCGDIACGSLLRGKRKNRKE